MHERKRVRVPYTLKAEGDGVPAGSVQAVFSVFNEIDADGDVVLPTAFTDGQDVPLVWAHNWERPIGKGTIRVAPTEALFDGLFNLNTSDGRDAYEAVKFAGPLQEFSWGFSILEADAGQFQGRAVRFIRRAEVYEVSPVLVGANRNTYTVAIKNGDELPLTDHIERVLADAEAVLYRARAHADRRRREGKEGRAISAQRRERLTALLDPLKAVHTELEALLAETAPPEKGAVAAEIARFFALMAETAGAPAGTE